MKQLVRNPLLSAAVVLVAVALLLPLVAWYGYRGNLANLERMLYGTGSSLLETVLRESENALLADHEISDLLADRLADNARFAADIQRRGLATPATLDSLARSAGLARLDVYSADKKLLASSRPENSPALLPEVLLDEYNEVEPGVFQSLVDTSDAGLGAEGGGTAYFAVALHLPSGRWAAAWIDGYKLTTLRRRLGLGLILDDLASVRGITYAVLQDSLGIIAASLQVVSLSSITGDPFFQIPEGRIDGRFTTFEGLEVYEVAGRFVFGGEDFGFLRLGLSTDEMRLIAAGDVRRLFLGLIVLAVLLAVVAGLYIYGRRQFSMELEHLRLRGFSRAVLDGMGEAVIVLDDEQRVVQLNPACRKFCDGFDEERGIGRPLEELSPPLAESVAALQKDNLAAREIELTGSPRGNAMPVLVTLSSQRIAGRDYTTLILTDISDRREKEQLALRGQRLRTMAEVSAGMAHEIRNPLNAIAMNVQRLKLEFSPAEGDREEYVQFVETIRGEVARLNRIVEQFLTFARFPHPVPEPVDLASLARDTVRFSAADLEAAAISVELELEPSGDLPLDPGQLRQVLTNLIANASQAIGSGGGKIMISGKRDENSYVMRIADSGAGIDSDDLEKIFEPFYTTRLKGTGLGLAIAARIIAEHGGTIRATNRAEGGAEFTLALPLGAAPAGGDKL